jgi:hypothetical protein
LQALESFQVAGMQIAFQARLSHPVKIHARLVTRQIYSSEQGPKVIINTHAVLKPERRTARFQP